MYYETDAMKKRFRRTIALLLTICVVLGAIPVPGFGGALAGDDTGSLPLATPTDLSDPNAAPAADPNATPAADPNAAPAADSNTAPMMLMMAAPPAQDDPLYVSVLQNMINEAMAEQETLTGRMQLVLQKDTTYEGDVTVSAGSRKVEDDFELELDAEDAGEDGLQSGGTTTIAGKLNIKGINVILRGILMDLKQVISVEKANLDYTGTNNGDTVTVELGQGGSASILTGEGADTVTVTATEGSGEAVIRTGDGSDTVTATVAGGGLEVDSGAGNDTVNVTVLNGSDTEETHEINVDTGKGNDSVTLVNEDSGSVTVDTGDGMDNVTADLRAGTGDVTIETGKGSDAVTAGNTTETLSESRPGTLTISNSGDNDRIELDVNLADTISDVVINGGEKGTESVLLTGTLQEGLENPITGTPEEFTLTAESGHELTVEAGEEARFTDTLENKRTVTLNPEGETFTYSATDNFTDYVIKSPVSDVSDITVTSENPLTLSKLVVDTDKTLDSKDHLTITKLDARGLNLVLRGEVIDILGEVHADSIRVEAVSGTGVHRKTLRLDSIDSAIESLAGMVADFVSVANTAEINIAKTAKIHSGTDIQMKASVDHEGGMLTLAPDLNAINVKVAHSRINIDGMLSAGEDGGAGNISVEAANTTTMGYDSDGNKVSGLPVTVNVAVDEAAVTVSDSGSVSAAGDILLNASNKIKDAATAESGTGGAPFAVAITVIVSNVHTTVEGILKAGGNATLKAKGQITDDLSSGRGEDQEISSGGYVGVNVVEQDVSAVIRSSADVQAGGDVTVRSDANADVTTSVVSAAPKKQPEASSLTVEAAGRLAKAYLTPVMAKIKEDNPDDLTGEKLEEYLDKLLGEVAEGDYSVSLTEPTARDERGVATVTTKTEEGRLYATVKVTPAAGVTVEKVRIRYLVPGEAKYTYAAPDSTDEDGNSVFLIAQTNTEVVVTYSGSAEESAADGETGGDSGATPDAFADESEEGPGSISDLFNTAASGANGSADEDEDIYGLQDLFDEGKATKLTIEEAESGAVVTYLEEEEGRSLSSVAPGQKVLFVPNPAKGWQLSEDSMKIAYTVTEEGKEVRKTDTLSPDGQGRYIFTVPEDVETAYGINLTANFELKTPEEEEKKAPSATQVTGSLAVTVLGNHNRAEIEQGARVTAAGSVNVTAAEVTNAVSTADGTAVAAGSSGSKDKAGKKPQQKTVTEYRAPGAKYAVRVNATQFGHVEATKNNQPETGHLEYEVKAGTVSRALLSYTSTLTGKRETTELTAGGGIYSVDLLSYAILNGSVAEITFLFAETADRTIYPDEYPVRNPIEFKFNALALDKETDPNAVRYKQLGNMVYVGADAKGKLYFDIAATETGYKLDPKSVYALYTNSSGVQKKASLKKGYGSRWSLDPAGADIPAGAVITLNAVFAEDLHTVKVALGIRNGKAEVSPAQAKTGDKVTVTLTPNDGFVGNAVTVSWVSKTGAKTESYTVDKNTGKAIFTVPDQLAEDAALEVSATFSNRDVTLEVSNKEKVKLSEAGLAFAGEKITVSPAAKLADQGNKVTKIDLEWAIDGGEVKIQEISGDTFTVPDNIRMLEKKTLKITATLEEKAITVKPLEAENGKVEAAAKVDAGETVAVKVKPAEGYRLKEGSLKAVVNDAAGSRQIKVTRGDKGYTFQVPDAEKIDPATCVISFRAEFEEGAENNGPENSIGVSVTVSVVKGNNDAAIRGGHIAAGKDIKVSADSSGKATATAKAGYSSGKIGFGGAVAVQVASQDTRARIYEDDNGFVSAAGQLTVASSGNQQYGVTGDASGKAQAQKAGVGAGIAVSVNATETTAAIQDGTAIDGKIKGLAITSKQKIKDSVTAKAGATGGTSVVPVAAVDVSGSLVSAALGKGAGTLDVAGNAKITSSDNAAHTIKADASATGGKTAIGGAFAVSVLSDKSLAEIDRDIKAKNVTLSSRTDSVAAETATAGVSGGFKGKKDDKDSSGSADKQANKLLSGGSKLAGKSGSSALSTAEVQGKVNGRQKAQTTEGSVAGAGAVSVNVQHSGSIARILDEADMNASGKLSVTSVNRTEAQIKANASATKSDKGVGVGVAVNIVNIENIAQIGNGIIRAGELEVLAHMPDPAVKSGITTIKQIRNEGAFITRLKSGVAAAAKDLLAEMGIPGDTAGKLAADFAGTFAEDLLKDLPELKKFLNKSSDITTAAANAEKLIGEKLDNFAKAAMQPLNDLLEDAADTYELTGDDVINILKDVRDLFTAELARNAKESITTLTGKMEDRVMASAIDMVTDQVSGRGWSSDKLKELLKADLKEILKDIVDRSLKAALQQLSTEIPLLSEENLDEIRELYSKGLTEDLNDMAGFITDTFRTEVFDYEKVLVAFAQQDLKKTVTEKLHSALKAGSVALTNDAMDELLGRLDVELEKAEDLTDKHVITTQAISGAGAKDVGVAGSVAVAVIHAKTEASIAESENALTVEKGLTVDAQEKRRVTTIASSAVNGSGDADANKGAGKAKQEDTGSGSDGLNRIRAGKLTIASAPGVKTEFDATAPDSNPRIWITPETGYTFTSGAKAEYTYTNDKGEEITGTVSIVKDGSRFSVRPYSAGDDLKAYDVTVKILPDENLHAVAAPAGDDLAPSGMAVSVEGREKEGESWKARAGDTVRVIIPRQDGVTLTSLTYTDAAGKSRSIETIGSSNDQETVYLFVMPDAEIKAIRATFWQETEEEEEQEAAPATGTKNSRGQSVGVGASFAFVYGSSEANALIGARSVTAGTLAASAASDHKESTSAVAGTDPLATDGKAASKAMDTAADAAVAVNALDTDIQAIIHKGSVNVTGYDAKGEDGKKTHTAGDLKLTAEEKGITDSAASGFATGSNTAVGAAVAVNVAASGIRVRLDADALLEGGAEIAANSHSEDITNAFATAMGADIQRALDKAGAAEKNIAEGANKLLDGSYLDAKAKDDKEKKNSGNKTAAKVNDKLNSKKDKDGSEASSNLSLSSNALRSQNASAESGSAGNEGGLEAGKQVKDATGKDVKTTRDDSKSKFQVAAAVGVNVTDHAAQTVVNGSIRARGDVGVSAENTGNFSTLGTGAAMSLANRANSIAAGVAVSVSNNQADVEINNDLEAGEGDVSLTANLTQNMDSPFRSKLAAQALSGSVAGSKSTVTIAGAVAVAVSHAESSVKVKAGTEEEARTLQGGHMTVEATDKSKLAARAGGISLSKGSSVGMGIASTTLVSGNKVEAAIGDNTEIEAKSLKMNAEKLGVTMDDYENPLSMRDLITDSSKLSKEERKSAKTGLIDVHKGKDDKNYSIEVHLGSQDLLKAMEAANILASRNYYTEAIAGSVDMGNESKLSLAGSAAVTVFSNTVGASLGKNAKVTLTEGGMEMNASADSNTRTIAGAVSVSKATAGVGATVAVLTDNDRVTAETGDGAEITAAGDITQKAKANADIQLFTAEAAVSGGMQAKAAAGGAVNVMVLKNTARSTLGDGVTLKAGGNAAMTSETNMDLMALSASVNATGGKVAAGGTVNVIVDETRNETTAGEKAAIEAGQDVTLASKTANQMISGIASVSAAATAGVAGAVNVLVSRSAAKTALAEGAEVRATEGDLSVTADSDAWMLNADLAAGGAGKAGIGGAISVNVFDRDALVQAGNAKLAAGNNLAAQSSARDTDILAGLALAGGGTAGIAGNVIVLAEKNRVRTEAADGMTAEAGNSALFESYFSDFTVMAAGSIAGGGTAGVGASIVTAVKDNDIQTKLNKSSVTAGAKKNAAATLAGEALKGIAVSAVAKETQFLGGAGVAGGGTAGVTGVVTTSVNNNKAVADASEATLVSGIGQASEEKTKTSGSIRILAADDTRQTLLSGGVNGAGTAGVGASVVTLVSNKTVEATALDAKGTQDTTIASDNRDDILNIAVSAGGAGTAAVEIGAAVQVLKSKVSAALLGDAEAEKGTLALTADNNTEITAIAAAVAGSGTAAVTPEAAVTYFKGRTDARMKDGSTASAANLKVSATSDKTLDTYTVGAAGSGAAGVSGAVNVIVAKDQTAAVLEAGTEAVIKNNADMTAKSDYSLTGAGAAIGAAGTAGVAVNATVSVLKGSAVAEAGGILQAGSSGKDNLNIKASAARKVLNAGASVGAAGTAGVGVTVLVLAAGEKMSQDAADMLMYGNAKDDKTKAAFDTDKFLKNAAAGGADVSDFQDEIAEDLEGDGTHYNDAGIGQKGSFDAASGMRSNEFDDKNFKDVNDTTEADSLRGENAEMTESAHVTGARKTGTYSYTSEIPADAVMARITETAEVKAWNVTVEASQPTTADLYGGTAAAAGTAGVGVSTAVAILRSNLSASSMGTVAAQQNITVRAVSSQGEIPADDGAAERDSALKKTLGDKLDPSGNAIRAVALTAAGGTAGIAAAVSVVRTDNLTQARVGGTLQANDSISIRAVHDYANVMAVTAAVSGGAVDVGASVAVTDAVGTVTAQAEEGTTVKAKENLDITTTANVGSNAAAATAGAGGVSVNAGLALAMNHLKQNTRILGGATAEATEGRLRVEADGVTNAQSYLLGVSVGGAGILLSGAVANTAAEADTRIGDSNGKKTTIQAKNLNVRNNIETAAKAGALSVAGGGAALGGNVMLAFNDTAARAKIVNADVTATNLSLLSDLAASTDSRLGALTVGGTAVGLSVNYADTHAVNSAKLSTDDTDLAISGDMTVRTGEGSRKNTSATAATVAGNAGAISGALNAAIARNRSESTASITGSNPLTVGGTLTLGAAEGATADANVTGVDIGGAKVGVSTAIALNEANTATTLKVSALHTGKAALANEHTASTDASLLTGGGAVLGIKAAVAVAYGRSGSTMDVELQKASEAKGGFAVNNTAGDNVRTRIDNLEIDAISATALAGAAFGQDKFATNVMLPMAGETLDVRNGSFTAKTTYNANTRADITPSTAGISLAGASLEANVTIAKAATTANTTVKGDAVINAKEAEIATDGQSTTNAKITTPKLTVNAVKVNANVLLSLLKTKQQTLASGTGRLVFSTPTGNIRITSALNEQKETGDIAEQAVADLGGTGTGGVSVTGANLIANIGIAKAAAVSDAKAEKVSVTGENGSLKVRSAGRSTANAAVAGGGVSVAAAGIGLNLLYAKAEGEFTASLANAGGMRVKNLDVETDYGAGAKAMGGASSGGTGKGTKISGLSVEVNVAEATVSTKAGASFTDSTVERLAGDMNVTVTGSNIRTESNIGSAKVSVSGIQVAANDSSATVRAVQNALVLGVNITDQGNSGNIRVKSTLSEAAANAKVGTSGGTNISLLSAKASTATADSNATVTAKVSQFNLPYGKKNLDVIAELTTDKASSDVSNGINIALANVSVVNTVSNARGTVNALFELSDNDRFTAGDVAVKALFNAESNAVVKATGATITVLNGSFNTTESKTEVNAEAKLKSTNSLMKLNSLQILTQGKITSVADAQTPTWEIGFGSVAANRSTARANSTQNAALEIHNGGIQTAGDATVQSKVDGSSAKAYVGSPANSKSVSLINGSTNTANAYEQLTSKVTILGSRTSREDSGSLLDAGGKLNVLNTGSTSAYGQSRAAAANGLMTLGNLAVNAYTLDQFLTSVKGLELHAGKELKVSTEAATAAEGSGSAPGGYTVMSASSSHVNSGVGRDDGNRQTVSLILEKNALLTSDGSISLYAGNTGSAVSSLQAKGSKTLGGVNSSSVPTSSWYKTVLTIGENAVLDARGDVSVRTYDRGKAASNVDADGLGLLLNLDTMRGDNTVNSKNTLTMSKNSAIGSKEGNISIQNESSSELSASSRYLGKFGIISGSAVRAVNNVSRRPTIDIGEGTNIVAEKGSISVYNLSGASDNIYTYSQVESSGVLNRATAYATANFDNQSNLLIRGGANLWAKNTVNVWSDVQINSMKTYAYSEASGFGINPHTEAVSNITNRGHIGLNPNAGDKVYLTSDNGDVNVTSDGWILRVYNFASAKGSAAGGGAYALADINVNILHSVQVDKTQLKAKKSASINAINSNAGGGNSYLNAEAFCKLYAAAGYVHPIARLRGSITNQITSRQWGGLEVALSGNSTSHYAAAGHSGISFNTSTSYDRLAIWLYLPTGWASKKVNLGLFKITIWYPTFGWVDISTTINLSERLNQLGYGARDDLGYLGGRSAADPGHADIGKLSKDLTSVLGSGAIRKKLAALKGYYNEDIERLAGELFVLELKVPLLKDAVLDKDALTRYRLWNNIITMQDTWMLPNATRLNTGATGKPSYVTEVMTGDAFGEGTERYVQVITALTDKAFNNAEAEINRTTVLNFATGMLTISSKDSLELFQSEVSAAWMLDKLMSGEMQAASNGGEALAALELGGTIPAASLMGRPESDEMESIRTDEGITLYWFGSNPEETEGTVYGMAVDEATDQYAFFRTSMAELLEGQVTLLSGTIWRDPGSDRKGEVGWHLMLRDTEEGKAEPELSIVTSIAGKDEMEVPASLSIRLRSFEAEGADGKAYRLSGHVFVLDNGKDGIVNLFGGQYTATFDGSTFESDYTRIEGCDTGILVITIKKDQPIWPEWDTETTAHDINKGLYKKEEETGEWVQTREQDLPETEENNDGTEAA